MNLVSLCFPWKMERPPAVLGLRLVSPQPLVCVSLASSPLPCPSPSGFLSLMRALVATLGPTWIMPPSQEPTFHHTCKILFAL